MDPTTIDVERVTAVLLIDDWHYIQPASFRINPYGFSSGETPVSKPQPGYFFSKVDQITRELQHFVGPLDCVMAIRYAIETEVVVEGDADADGEFEDEEDF